MGGDCRFEVAEAAREGSRDVGEGGFPLGWDVHSRVVVFGGLTWVQVVGVNEEAA